MMRQTKTAIVTWSVAGVLVAGLLVFGCSRQAGHKEYDEHLHGEGHTEHGGESPREETGMKDGVHSGEEEHAPGESGMPESMQKPELTGKLNDGVRIIEMKARKFEFDPAKVVVKKGEIVRLNITSEDVMHGIGIEAFEINEKLPPNETVTVEFTADKTGTHQFYCTVYCGAGHGNMHGGLVVLAE